MTVYATAQEMSTKGEVAAAIVTDSIDSTPASRLSAHLRLASSALLSAADYGTADTDDPPMPSKLAPEKMSSDLQTHLQLLRSSITQIAREHAIGIDGAQTDETEACAVERERARRQKRSTPPETYRFGLEHLEGDSPAGSLSPEQYQLQLTKRMQSQIFHYDRHLRECDEALKALHSNHPSGALSKAIPDARPAQIELPKAPLEMTTAMTVPELDTDSPVRPGYHDMHVVQEFASRQRNFFGESESGTSRSGGGGDREGEGREALWMTQEDRLFMSTALRAAVTVTETILHGLHDTCVGATPSSSVSGSTVLFAGAGSKTLECVFELHRLLSSAHSMFCRFRHTPAKAYGVTYHAASAHTQPPQSPSQSEHGSRCRIHDSGVKFRHLWSAIDDLELHYLMTATAIKELLTKALRRWAGIVHVNLGRYTCLLSSVLILKNKRAGVLLLLARRALSSWIALSSATARARRLLVLAHERIQRHQQRVAVHAWRWAAASRRAERVRAAMQDDRLARQHAALRLRVVLNVWQEMSQRCCSQLASLQRIQRRMVEKRLSQNWNGWRDVLEGSRFMATFLQRQARRRLLQIRRKQTNDVFDRWREHTREEKALKMKALKVMQKLMNGAFVAAFGRWREHTRDEKKIRSTARRVIHKLTNCAFVSAFEVWRDMVKEDVRLRALGLRVVQRMLKGAFVRAFEDWREFVAKQEHLRGKARNVVTKLMFRPLAAALERWREHTREEKALKMKALKVVQKLMNGAFVAAFDRWREHTRDEKGFRSQAQRVIRKVLQRALVSGFDLWVVRVAEATRLRIIIAKLAARVLNGLAFSAFATWRLHVQASQISNFKMTKAIARWWWRSLLLCFVSWRQRCWEETRKREVLVRIADKMKNRILFKGYSSWAYTCAAAVARRACVRRVISRMANRVASRSFQSWVEAVSTLKEGRIVAHRTLMRLIKGQLRKALQGWTEGAAALRRCRHKLQSAVSRMMMRQAAVALTAWLQSARAQGLRALLLRRAALRMSSRRAAYALASWVSVALVVRRLRHASKKIAHRWRRQAWARPFEKWRLRMAAQKGLVRACVAIAKHWQGAQLYKSLATWLDCVHGSLRLLALGSRVANRSARAASAVAFERWQESVVLCRYEKRLQRSAVKVIMHVLRRSMGTACAGWMLLVRRNKRLKTKAAKLQSRLQYAAWVTWHTCSKGAQALKNALETKGRKAVMRALRRVLVEAYLGWQEWVGEGRLLQLMATRVRRAKERVCRRVKASGIEIWREYACRRKVALLALDRIAGARQSRLQRWLLGKCVEHCRSFARNSRYLRCQTANIMLRQQRRHCMRVLASWLRQALSRASARGLLDHFMRCVRSQHRRQALRSWQHGAHASRRQKRFAAIIATRRKRGLLTWALWWWFSSIIRARLRLRADVARARRDLWSAAQHLHGWQALQRRQRSIRSQLPGQRAGKAVMASGSLRFGSTSSRHSP